MITAPDRRPPLRELELLLEVVALRKITAAAQKLGISQPAASRALARLEQRLGWPLFERQGRLLVPNQRAVALAEEAEAVFRMLDNVVNPTSTRDGKRMLRIIGPPTLMHMFIADLAAAFLRAEPDVTLTLEIGKSPDVVAAVADGLADVGMSDTRPANAAVRTECFRRTDAHVVMPRHHRLAARDEITAADLADEPLVLLARRFATRGHLDRLFLDGGHAMRLRAETTTAAAAYALVRAGVGLAVINPFPLSLEPDDDFVFRLFRPTITIESLAFTPALGRQDALVRRFIEFVRKNQPRDLFGRMVGPSGEEERT